MAEDSQNDQSVEDTGTPEQVETPQAEDPIKNLKSEVSRKFENQQALISQMNDSFKALAARLQAQQKPTAPQQSIREKLYDDPDAAAEIITERAVERATAIVANNTQRQQAMQQRVFELTSEYPEFNQGSSEASLAAQRIHATLPESLKNTAEGAELAIQRAAMQLGLVPSSRRRKPAGADDGFIPSSKGNPRANTQARENQLSDEQFTFAHLLNESIGRKMDDKVQANLKKYAGRKTWNKFGTGEES